MQEATALSAKISGARESSRPRSIPSRRATACHGSIRCFPSQCAPPTGMPCTRMVKDSRPDAKLPNLNFLAGQMSEFTAGMQSAETGDVAAAEASSQRLDADLGGSPSVCTMSPLRRSRRSLRRPWRSSCRMQRLPRCSAISPSCRSSCAPPSSCTGSSFPEAKTLFDEAAHEEKHLGYREPPAYIRPVGETEGAVLLRAGDAEGHTPRTRRRSRIVPIPASVSTGWHRPVKLPATTASAREEYARFSPLGRTATQTGPS